MYRFPCPQAHVSHPPRQVAKCLNQLNDYITLVSTRLHDLGEKVSCDIYDVINTLFYQQVPSSGEGAVDDVCYIYVGPHDSVLPLHRLVEM